MNYPKRKNQSECSRSHTATALPFRISPEKSHSIASTWFLCWKQSQVCSDSRGGDVNLPCEGNWQDHIAKERGDKRYDWGHLWKTQPDERCILSGFLASSCLCREEPVSPTFPALGIWVCKDYALFFLNSILRAVCSATFSHVWLFATPWTVVCQASLSMEFSRQVYWSGLPCPSPGDLSNRGIKPRSPVSSASQADSLPLSH